MPTMTRPPATAHTIRVPDELWNAALAQATDNDETVSVVLRRALRNYIENPHQTGVQCREEIA